VLVVPPAFAGCKAGRSRAYSSLIHAVTVAPACLRKFLWRTTPAQAACPSWAPDWRSSLAV